MLLAVDEEVPDAVVEQIRKTPGGSRRVVDPGRHGTLNSVLPDAGRPRAGEEPASGGRSVHPAGLDALLVLLRHGHTQFIVENRFQGAMEAPLTPLGERQARLAGQRLAAPSAHPSLPIPDSSPFAIIHSPLGRARRSAQLVVEEMAAAGRATPPLRSDPGFSEIAQGAWEGLTEKEITARFGERAGQLATMANEVPRLRRRRPRSGGRARRDDAFAAPVGNGCRFRAWDDGPPSGSGLRRHRPGASLVADRCPRWSLPGCRLPAAWTARSSISGTSISDLGLCPSSRYEPGGPQWLALNLDSQLDAGAAPETDESSERRASGALLIRFAVPQLRRRQPSPAAVNRETGPSRSRVGPAFPGPCRDRAAATVSARPANSQLEQGAPNQLLRGYRRRPVARNSSGAFRR